MCLPGCLFVCHLILLLVCFLFFYLFSWHLKMVCQQWDKVQHFNMRLCLDHNNNRCGLSTAARVLVCLSSCVSMCVCVCVSRVTL